jgi:thiamine transport system permease protein
VLTLAVGLPAASVVARLSARRQRLVRALVTVPFVLPTVVVAGAFTELFAVAGLDDGAFRLRHTVWAILIAHVFFNYAVVVRAVGSYWAGLDQRVEEAARVLGAGAWQTFGRSRSLGCAPPSPLPQQSSSCSRSRRSVWC